MNNFYIPCEGVNQLGNKDIHRIMIDSTDKDVYMYLQDRSGFTYVNGAITFSKQTMNMICTSWLSRQHEAGGMLVAHPDMNISEFNRIKESIRNLDEKGMPWEWIIVSIKELFPDIRFIFIDKEKK